MPVAQDRLYGDSLACRPACRPLVSARPLAAPPRPTWQAQLAPGRRPLLRKPLHRKRWPLRQWQRGQPPPRRSQSWRL